MLNLPQLGFGCGLRLPHYPRFLAQEPSAIDWLEIIAENFLDWTDGTRLRSREVLEKVLLDYPIAVHGVSLSLGSATGLDFAHLKRVKALLDETQAAWFSDHLCWTGVDGINRHDLLPLPYNAEAIRTVVENISRVQDFLKRRILIENLSSYVTFENSEMPEWDFLSEVARQADCGLLLDINNVYVSSRNHHFDPQDYLNAVPAERVGQIHLAGHEDKGTHTIDTHSQPVCDAVWDLYRGYTAQHGARTTLIEWDDDIPSWERLEEEVLRAKQLTEGRRADSIVDRTPAPL